MLIWLLVSFGLASAVLRLEQLAQLKLPYDILSNTGMLTGAANTAAYEPINHRLYVTATERLLLHVVRLFDPANPEYRSAIEYTLSEGRPTDVAVCGNRVAVSLATAQRQPSTGAIMAGEDGHVLVYKLDPVPESGLEEEFHSIPVGVDPVSIKFSDDCHYIVTANAGYFGQNLQGTFIDPPGSFSILEMSDTAAPITRTLFFDDFNPPTALPANVRYVYRGSGTVNPFSNDVQPSDVIVAPNNQTAYLSCARNNAVFTLNLASTDSVIASLQSYGVKDWNSRVLDPSSADGGINLVNYQGLTSFRMPYSTSIYSVDGVDYLIAANQGAVTNYNATFVDFDTGINAWVDNKISSTNPLSAQIQVLAQLGDLRISLVDGLDGVSLVESTHFFGGRGISLHLLTNVAAPEFDSGNEFENVLSQTPLSDTFHTDVGNTATQSPTAGRDSTSGMFGPEPRGVAVTPYATQQVIATSARRSGVIFLYSQKGVAVQPLFQSAHRSGGTTSFWDTLYAANNVGDAIISDMGYILGEDRIDGLPILWVVSEGSGTVGVYKINDEE